MADHEKQRAGARRMLHDAEYEIEKRWGKNALILLGAEIRNALVRAECLRSIAAMEKLEHSTAGMLATLACGGKLPYP